MKRKLLTLSNPVREKLKLPMLKSLVPEIAGSATPTFTRSSAQTVMGYAEADVAGAAQRLLTIPAGVPCCAGARFIASNNTWSNVLADGSAIPKAITQGVLFEGTGTNLKTNSESFELWSTLASPRGTTVSVNAALSPNGEMTADLIIPVVSYGGHSRYDGFVGAVNTTYTFSVWLKAGGYNYAAISLENSGFPSTSRVLIDLVNGVIITGTYTNTTAYTIFSGKNGWYRVSTQNTSDSDGGPYIPVIEIWTSSKPVLFTGDGVSGVYAFGADVKAANFLSSYIATTTAAASRAATVLSYPTLNNIASGQFTIALEFTPTHTPSGTIYLWGSYVDANNGTYLLHDGTNLILRKRIGGTNYDATIVNPFVANQMYRIVAKSSHNGMNTMLDGKLGTMNSNSSPAQLGTTFEVGSDGQGGNQPFAYIKDLKHYSKALSVSKMSGVSL